MQRCIISNVCKQIILPQYIPIFVIKAWYKIYVFIVFIKHFKKSVKNILPKALYREREFRCLSVNESLQQIFEGFVGGLLQC